MGKKPPRMAHSDDDRLAIVAVGIFLAIIVWAVFGQTIHHGFINYDDGIYVYQNPEVLAGLTWRGIRWAFTYTRDRALASGYLVFAHARCIGLGSPRRRPSSYQCAASHDDSDPALSGPKTNDGRVVAECCSRGSFCRPSTAGRIGRLDRGAQGCIERIVFRGHDSWLPALHSPAEFGALCDGSSAFRARAYVEKYVGYSARGAVAAGLLAAWAL